MPASTATGAFGIQIQNLADLISESTEFQNKVSANDAAEALEYVHYPFMGERRPAAFIEAVAISQRRLAGGGQDHLFLSGQLRLTFTDISRAPNDIREDFILFDNWTHAVMEDLRAVWGQDQNISVSNVDLDEGPVRTDVTERGAGDVRPGYWLASYIIDWGQE